MNNLRTDRGADAFRQLCPSMKTLTATILARIVAVRDDAPADLCDKLIDEVQAMEEHSRRGVKAVIAKGCALGLPPGDMRYLLAKITKAAKMPTAVLQGLYEDCLNTLDGHGVLHSQAHVADVMLRHLQDLLPRLRVGKRSSVGLRRGERSGLRPLLVLYPKSA